MNQNTTMLFQFIAVNNHVTDKFLEASWCCETHRLSVQRLMLDMNQAIIDVVAQHKDNLDELPAEFEETIEECLLVLDGIDKTIERMNEGMTITMNHGGVV